MCWSAGVFIQSRHLSLMYKNIVDICIKSSILDKQLARYGGGPKILKVGHMTHHDPFDLILQFFVRTTSGRFVCQI